MTDKFGSNLSIIGEIHVMYVGMAVSFLPSICPVIKIVTVFLQFSKQFHLHCFAFLTEFVFYSHLLQWPEKNIA